MHMYLQVRIGGSCLYTITSWKCKWSWSKNVSVMNDYWFNEHRASEVLRSARSFAHFPVRALSCSFSLFSSHSLRFWSLSREIKGALWLLVSESHWSHIDPRETQPPREHRTRLPKALPRVGREREQGEKKSFKGGDVCIFFTGAGRTELELFLCRGTWNNEARAGFNKARFPSFQLWREADEPATESDR